MINKKFYRSDDGEIVQKSVSTLMESTDTNDNKVHFPSDAEEVTDVEKIKNSPFLSVDPITKKVTKVLGSNLGASSGISLEQFKDVMPVGKDIIISHENTPFARVRLSDEKPVFDLSIIDVKDGVSGKVIIIQDGYRQVALDSKIIGSIDLPLKPGTMILCSYNVIGEQIFLHSDIILGDTEAMVVSPITDLTVRYYDNTSVSFQWTAPHAETLDSPVTYYDIRYSNNKINPEDSVAWNSIKRVANTLVPLSPGELESFTVIGLKPGTNYYFYIKSAKVTLGLTNFSHASNELFIKTNGAANIDEATYNIPIENASLYPQHYSYVTDSATGRVASIDNIVDEKDKNSFLPTGYPDTTKKDFETYWLTYKYSRDTAPFYIDIDLYQIYRLDRIYIYSATKTIASIYGSKGFGYPWVKVGEMNSEFNAWAYVNFEKGEYRMIRIGYDIIDFGSMSTSPSMPAGTEAFPDPQYGTTEKINNMLVYGLPLSKPDKIHEPLRRTTVKKTVDEFFNVNGHAYQQGRIHALSGGSKPRIYIHFGQFAQFDINGSLIMPTSIQGLKFRVNDIGWVKSNSGLNEGLEYNLRETYSKYGLRPYLTNTGVFDPCYYDQNNKKHNRPHDDYWYPNAWRPVPKRGYDGLERYYASTKDPAKYRTYSKLAYALGAKYGNNPNLSGEGLFWPLTESTTTGLNLISGLEMENEPDANWNGWIGYQNSEEYAAVMSASADGHGNTLKDESGKNLGGIKATNILSVSSGTAGINKGYYFSAIHWWKAHRNDANVPVDSFSLHRYFSNVGNQGTTSQESVRYGVTLESSLSLGDTGGSVLDIVKIRDRISYKTELWLTEFGWGESGAEGTKSSYQCYTQPGRVVNGWIIPDRHRSEVKGAWTVRATLQLMALGYDMCNYYSTECENNYFDNSRYGTGPGFEMFHWNDISDTTPGAKATYIKQFEHQFERGGFASLGLFGQMLGNGAYPITNSYWWTATMRNALKGYVFYGKKKIASDSKIEVLAFRKPGEEKGAYVVYYNDMVNTGVTDVVLSIPDAAENVEKVSVYLPQIPNPLNVPRSLGNDQARTGLPTSRREKYIGGQWVVVNKKYDGINHSSYTNAPANYPANPKEGDEVTTLPTLQENPYFPIVGPVQARASSHELNLSAQQYEQSYDDGGVTKWEAKNNQILSWRQVDAVCDFIEHTVEGRKGANGVKSTINKLAGKITVNVSEFPEFYLFDGIPEIDFESKVTDLSATPINDSIIDLWWNNTNVEDTGYDIFISNLPETGFTLHSSVDAGSENKVRIQGLAANTTYYFKIRPKKGSDLIGQMSDEVGVQTFSSLPAPNNLKVVGRTTNQIAIFWDYPPGQVADFMYYGIYRMDSSSVYALVGRVENLNTHLYIDTGLSVGKSYQYKIRAIGLNGVSPYSNEIDTRTLLPEEMPPALKQVATDKLGIKISFQFDMNVDLVNSDPSFVVIVAQYPFDSEDPDLKEEVPYTDMYVSPENPNTIILTFPRFSLPEYNRLDRQIRVSYNGTNVISSQGNIPLQPFQEYVVKNKNGDFSGISRVFNFNLTDDANLEPADRGWNNIIFATGQVEYSNIQTDLKEPSDLKLIKVDNGTSIKWGGISNGATTILDIQERTIWKKAFLTAFGAKENEAIKARLTLENLDQTKVYRIDAYGGVPDNDVNLKKPLRLKVGNQYSETIQTALNRSKYFVIDTIRVGPSATFDIDFITMYAANSANNTAYPGINFFTLTEMDNPDDQVNKELLLRGISIAPINPKGDIVNATVQVSYNIIGEANRYRISEDPNMDGIPWINITSSSSLVFPYTLQNPSVGNVTIYVQAANNNNETDILSYTGNVKLQFGLEEFNVNIINGKSITTKRAILANLIYTGNAIEYAVETTDNFSASEWKPLTTQFEINLSSGLGVKELYARVRNAAGTQSATIQHSIELISDINETVIFDNGDGIISPTANKVEQGKIGDTGYYSSKFRVEYSSAIKPEYGSHYLYNSLGELTNMMVHFNTDKYPIVNTMGFRAQNTLLEYRSGYAMDTDTIRQLEYPLNEMEIREARSPANVGTYSGYRARIAMNLPAGNYALKIITSVPYNELAIPQNEVNNSFFTILNAVTNAEIARAPMGPAQWNGVLNTTYNVILPFTLTAAFNEIYISSYAPSFPKSPIYHRMVLVKNYVLIEPLSLQTVTINNGAELTYTNTVSVIPGYKGIPTEYRIAETQNSLLGAPWLPYSGGSVDFTFTDWAGLKNVFMQLRSADVVTDVKYGTINYVKDNIDLTEFTVTVPEGVDPNSITLEFPKNKFNKKILFSYITDDTCSIYQFIFSGINKRYVATNETSFFHLNYPISPDFTEGFIPDYPLEFTDGAGNKRRFSTSIAGWPDKLVDAVKGIGADVGKNWPWMSEKEFKMFHDFGFTMLYHDLDGYKKAEATQDTFNQWFADTKAHFIANLGENIIPKGLAEPNGDHLYLTLSQAIFDIKFLTAQSGDTRIKKVYPYKSDYNLSKSNTTIERYFAGEADYADKVFNQLMLHSNTADLSTIQWLIGAAHRSSLWEYNLFKRINDSFGAIGLDNIWFATIDEIYEYWFLTRNAQVEKVVEGQTVTFKIKTPIVERFWFKELTCLLTGVSSLSGITVTSNTEGLSYNVNSGKLMVNLNFTQYLSGLANKYTSKFEMNPSDPYNYDDAMYMIQLLKPSLRQAYLDRIDALLHPVDLVYILVNGGASTHTGKTVSVEFVINEGNPTHYRLAESESALEAAPWVTWTVSQINYTFDSFGNKTLYGQVKNQTNNSVIRNANINLIESAPKVLLGFNTTTKNVVVKVSSSGLMTNQIDLSTFTSYGAKTLVDTNDVAVPAIVVNLNSSFYAANNFFIANGTTTITAMNATVASGPYSLGVMQRNFAPTQSGAESTLRKARISFSLAAGTYRIRVLMNTTANYSITSNTTRQQTFYGVFQGNTELVRKYVSDDASFTGIGNQDFNQTLEFTITDASTPVDFGAWSTALNNRPSFNLLEITKLS
ncbi:fibronectin type III domain-containing protein [Sphingobacterium sp.]|uniref:fibronectin type III domain-containing protein n=1 Tax=Sphingobacterium sp. TaxID=341027 RepID=UPI0031D43294